ncbi:Maltase 1 [Bulinus truncatus]|nr:Maltase 1 [Bulinus truncatus]
MRNTLQSLALLIFGHFWPAYGQLLNYDKVIIPDVTKDLTWWKTGIVYQVYPRSFKDSNGDGIGDIKGIISEIDYFLYLGINCIWLSPVYKSPMVDFGYDIADYKDIDPIFGTVDDFKLLVSEIHKKGLKLITDFVPGHVSTEHEWLRRSVRRDGKYTDYFIWSDGRTLVNGTRVPPNNWLSAFCGSAWKWNEQRGQFYYHAFDPTQADLNYRDENLRWEMEDTLRYWLDLGVDGFRVDAFSPLYETQNVYQDEPLSGKNVHDTDYDFLDHIYTTNQPESIPTLSSWYQIMNEYTQQDGKDRFMVVEVFSTVDIRNRVYVTGASPFNFDLIHMSSTPTGQEIVHTVLNEYFHLPEGAWPNFVLGNHDNRRVSHRYGARYVNVYNMLLLTLWGTPTTYYGEELGMLEADVSWNETVDPAGRNTGPDRYQNFTRDPERSPMQWSSQYQAGFTTGNTTWLPLGDNYTTINVQSQKESNEQTSLKLYRQVAHLRKRQAFQTGTFKVILVTNDAFAYLRTGVTEEYMVVLNFGQSIIVTDLSGSGRSTATVSVLTPGLSFTVGQLIQLKTITLESGHGLILKLDTSLVKA